ncbi:MAG: ATP-binding cassette domain-containing protein [Eubacteriales bacterium]|nr:ATP-binding cassette domain-containing protein [Eubacteriales bacterium]MDD3073164.1 ATP-binding cassette domain-containing protein [Eubacteriales bacterium]MDD4079240.1 ATP-binding cassette domain-containing protein [Eubacteriales bacterium]MDD4768482.1 ATP-binding cassette domain-containing protein [Eubacteriales bacterium]
MEKSKIIEVKDLVFCYPDGTKAIEDISIDFYDGEFIAFIGTNGCGKTTFSKCLNGILKATSGTIKVNGIDVVHTKDCTELVKNIGYVFQNPDHQLFNNNIYDEIAYAPRNLRIPEDEVKQRVTEAAAIAGVTPEVFEEHPFFQVKGIRQRIAIASILSLRPKVIIVDEPTTGQDYKQSIEVMEFLKMLNEKHGHTIIIITHEMDIVAEYAKRVVVMTGGRVLSEGSVQEVFAQTDLLEKANIKPPQVTRLAQRLESVGFDNNIISPEKMFEQWRQLAKQPIGK